MFRTVNDIRAANESAGETWFSPFRTVDDIRAANESAGETWFSPDTMEYWACAVHPRVYGGRLFVTSERGAEDGDQRMFTVRVADDDGSISTVGEFRQYATLTEAFEAAAVAAGSSDYTA